MYEYVIYACGFLGQDIRMHHGPRPRFQNAVSRVLSEKLYWKSKRHVLRIWSSSRPVAIWTSKDGRQTQDLWSIEHHGCDTRNSPGGTTSITCPMAPTVEGLMTIHRWKPGLLVGSHDQLVDQPIFTMFGRTMFGPPNGVSLCWYIPMIGTADISP